MGMEAHADLYTYEETPIPIPGTVSTVQDTWVGSFIIVKEVLSLLCDAAFLKHGIWYVIICWLRWKKETSLIKKNTLGRISEKAVELKSFKWKQ